MKEISNYRNTKHYLHRLNRKIDHISLDNPNISPEFGQVNELYLLDSNKSSNKNLMVEMPLINNITKSQKIEMMDDNKNNILNIFNNHQGESLQQNLVKDTTKMKNYFEIYISSINIIHSNFNEILWDIKEINENNQNFSHKIQDLTNKLDALESRYLNSHKLGKANF